MKNNKIALTSYSILTVTGRYINTWDIYGIRNGKEVLIDRRINDPIYENKGEQQENNEINEEIKENNEEEDQQPTNEPSSNEITENNQNEDENNEENQITEENDKNKSFLLSFIFLIIIEETG